MPLHDFTNRYEWEGVHSIWQTFILLDLQDKLPAGYRVMIGTSPFARLEAVGDKPDVSAWRTEEPIAAPDGTAIPQPDFELAVAVIDPEVSLMVTRSGRLVAAIEIVSPRNKDRPSSRGESAARYAGYLRGGVHLMLIDVHRLPANYGFPRAMATELDSPLPGSTAPNVASYRVGGYAAAGGHKVAGWHRPLAIGAPLPDMPLPLGEELAVMVDLEGTYSRAAARCYLG